MRPDGASRRAIEVVPHDPAWASLFREEERKLRALFGGALLVIHHIGSTAVPGLAAKPIVDMLGVARDIGVADGRNGAMARLGYRAMGEYGIPGRRFFIREVQGGRTHHLHVFGDRHPRIRDHLGFRDHLLGHPEEAQAYGRLKQELARRFPHDIEAYMAGKDPFIRGILRRIAPARPGNPL
ncbi:MAG: GrpB family protein [Candidatus Eisenbacteria bacterium]